MIVISASASTGTTSNTYRVDLDGLRGLSIALVVIFHIFVGRVSGGVDVFLFLSGYFFLGSQIRYALRDNPSLNPWWPLWRTARRLLPGLITVLASTGLIIAFIVPSLMSYDLARQFTASVFFYQNWELTTQGADYAAANPDVSPLQHLWSISVQGQFYVLAIALGILVAWLTSTRILTRDTARRSTIVVPAVVTVASFLWAARNGFIGTESSYYSLYTRLWELTLGGLLALLADRMAIPARYSGLAAGAGLIMIAITGVVITTTLAFPGPLTLLPIGGAVLVVLANANNPVSHVLASRPVTWLGTIAYPLYLWHWPLLIAVLTRETYAQPPVYVGIGIILVSALLAWITHNLIEEPLRMHRPRPTALDTPWKSGLEKMQTWPGALRACGGVVVAAVTVSVLAFQPLWVRGAEGADEDLNPREFPGAMALVGQRVPDLAPRPLPQFASSIDTDIARDGCVIMQDLPGDDLSGQPCVFGDPTARTTVALVGGSHAETYGIALDLLGEEHGFKVVTFIRQSCPFVLTPGEIVTDQCAEWSNHVLDDIEDLDPDLVISTSTRPDGPAGGGLMTQDYVPDEYQEAWNALAQRNLRFFGLRDNPWFFDDSGTQMDPNGCLVNGGSVESCTMPAEAIYAPADPAARFADDDIGRYMLDTSQWYCPDGQCPPVIGNVTVYRDQNHISNAYSLSLAPLLWDALGPLLSDEIEGPGVE